MIMNEVTPEHIRAACERIAGKVERTPTVLSQNLSERFGVPVTRSFRIDVRSNEPPAVAAIDPKSLECVEGNHVVDLATVVTDPDADPLTVTWKVDGSRH